jgi:hypothetical protein
VNRPLVVTILLRLDQQGYDPRKQRWYLEASNLDSFWTDQFVDAAAGQKVIAVSSFYDSQSDTFEALAE